MLVKITDKTHYVTDTSGNGGNYSYTVIYRQLPMKKSESDILLDGKFEVIHSTSSEFPYCSLCGNFFQDICPCGMDRPEVVGYYGENSVHDAIMEAIERKSKGEDVELEIFRDHHIK